MPDEAVDVDVSIPLYEDGQRVLFRDPDFRSAECSGTVLEFLGEDTYLVQVDEQFLACMEDTGEREILEVDLDPAQ